MTRLRVLQTAQAKYGQMWDVDELRFYDHGAEVARKPGAWKVRAWPNSFEAQLAFDNSEATRWRTWETASPGDYLDVDFGEQTAVDEVRVETSNQSTWPMHLQVETINAQGRWQQITDQFEIQPHVFHGSIRRQATYEMHRRGVDYLLVMDNAWGADDFRDDPESWGLEVIGRSSHASLYKVMP